MTVLTGDALDHTGHWSFSLSLLGSSRRGPRAGRGASEKRNTGMLLYSRVTLLCGHVRPFSKLLVSTSRRGKPSLAQDHKNISHFSSIFVLFSFTLCFNLFGMYFCTWWGWSLSILVAR